MAKIKEMNMCEGRLLSKIIMYALPLIATNILQLLFNTADVAVLGIFASDNAVAAVGATGSLVSLLVNLFVGLSVGANVVIARFVGQEDADRSHKAVGTSIILSVILGSILAAVGYFGSYTFLTWMKCDAEVIELSAAYLKIYFLGMPIIMLYNFSSSILRAVGDTVRPLVYLIIGGIANVVLNVIFIIVFGMDVEGVALATVLSQGISAVPAVISLFKNTGYAQLDKKHLRIYRRELTDILVIGIPSGIQSCFFDISNVLLQTAINSFGKVAMTGVAAASQFDGFIYRAMNGISLSTLAFVSQNYGAGNYDRIRKTVRQSAALVSAAGLLIGGIIAIFARPLCSIITTTPEALDYACERLYIMSATYFMCGIMEVLSNTFRGLGRSTSAMIISLSGSCLFRIVWLETAFKMFRSITTIYLVYPISWIITISIYIVLYFPLMKKTKQKLLKSAS